MAVTNPYSSQTIANYNDTPPPNDATTGSDNVVDWDIIKDELADPVKLLAENLNTELVNTFSSLVSQINDQLSAQFSFLDKTADYTIVSGDLAGETIVRVDASAGNVIIDLPTVAVMQDKIVTIVASTDPAGNSVRVDESDSVTEIWTGYAKGDFFKLTSDGTNYIPIDERTTVYGHLALTADESIGANATQKVFDVNVSPESDVGGWWDNVTNFRINVGFDCILEVQLLSLGTGVQPLEAVFAVNGTNQITPIAGGSSGAVNRYATWTFPVTSGDFVEYKVFNDNASPQSIAGDAAKDESQARFRVVKRTR
jgi:hypothetical protein